MSDEGYTKGRFESSCGDGMVFIILMFLISFLLGCTVIHYNILTGGDAYREANPKYVMYETNEGNTMITKTISRAELYEGVFPVYKEGFEEPLCYVDANNFVLYRDKTAAGMKNKTMDVPYSGIITMPDGSKVTGKVDYWSRNAEENTIDLVIGDIWYYTSADNVELQLEV